MKKTLIAAAAAAAAALIAAPAMAQDFAGYVDLGATYVDLDGTADLGGATVRVGGTYQRYFGAEVEATIGLVDDGHTGAREELNQQGAIYAVGHLPLGDSLDLMARAGWGRTQYEFSGAETTASSWNYGLAAQYNLDDNQGVRADWTRHDYENTSINGDFYSLSYVRRF
jgi:hypothetical protein